MSGDLGNTNPSSTEAGRCDRCDDLDRRWKTEKIQSLDEKEDQLDSARLEILKQKHEIEAAELKITQLERNVEKNDGAAKALERLQGAYFELDEFSGELISRVRELQTMGLQRGEEMHPKNSETNHEVSQASENFFKHHQKLDALRESIRSARAMTPLSVASETGQEAAPPISEELVLSTKRDLMAPGQASPSSGTKRTSQIDVHAPAALGNTTEPQPAMQQPVARLTGIAGRKPRVQKPLAWQGVVPGPRVFPRGLCNHPTQTAQPDRVGRAKGSGDEFSILGRASRRRAKSPKSALSKQAPDTDRGRTSKRVDDESDSVETRRQQRERYSQRSRSPRRSPNLRQDRRRSRSPLVINEAGDVDEDGLSSPMIIRRRYAAALAARVEMLSRE